MIVPSAAVVNLDTTYSCVRERQPMLQIVSALKLATACLADTDSS